MAELPGTSRTQDGSGRSIEVYLRTDDLQRLAALQAHLRDGDDRALSASATVRQALRYLFEEEGLRLPPNPP